MEERMLVNEEKLLDQLDNDRDFFKEMLTEFEQFTAQQLVELDTAIAVDNHVEVRSLAHSIKGAAANLFIERLADDARTLEYMGRNGQLVGAAEVLGSIRKEFEVLKSYIAGL